MRKPGKMGREESRLRHSQAWSFPVGVLFGEAPPPPGAAAWVSRSGWRWQRATLTGLPQSLSPTAQTVGCGCPGLELSGPDPRPCVGMRT